MVLSVAVSITTPTRTLAPGGICKGYNAVAKFVFVLSGKRFVSVCTDRITHDGFWWGGGGLEDFHVTLENSVGIVQPLSVVVGGLFERRCQILILI